MHKKLVYLFCKYFFLKSIQEVLIEKKTMFRTIFNYVQTSPRINNSSRVLSFEIDKVSELD